MTFRPAQRQSLAEQLAGTLRDAIVIGRFQPGDSLPAERELAEQFRVNRSSVREALHRLEAWGLVEIRHGGGTRVTDFLTEAGLQLLPFLLAPAGVLDRALLRDVQELRMVLLGYGAARAALRATPAQITALEEAVSRIEAAQDPEAARDADFDFYDALVAASGNRVLQLVSGAIRRIYTEHRPLFADVWGPGIDPAFHRDALAAVRARDPAAARAVMEAYGGHASQTLVNE